MGTEEGRFLLGRYLSLEEEGDTLFWGEVRLSML
jgi:hypothetical protein